MTTVLDWTLWAPPLDPPTAGGLPADAAQAIADATWDTDPHLCAALQWEAYAGMLPPSGPAVSQVATGVQSLTYSPPSPGGAAGAALAQAAWHRSLMASLGSAPLTLAPPSRATVPGDPWSAGYPIWWPDAEAPGENTAPAASFTIAPPSPGTQDNITLDGTGSTGGVTVDGSPTEIVRWDWLLNGATTRSGAVVTWRLPSAHGDVTLSLTVYDELGGYATTVQVITI